MTQKTTLIDWTLSFVAVIVVLSVMGAMDSADQEQSAKVLADAKQHAKATAKRDQKAKAHAYAELEARSRYMTSFDQISYAKAGK